MKHYTVLFVIGLLLGFPSCTPKQDITRAEQIRADLLNPNSQRVLVVSHRADWRGWPENSLPAIESAINMGVDVAWMS